MQEMYNLLDQSPPQIQIEDYISLCQLPKLPTEIQEELETPFKLEELQQAVSTAKMGKAPGLDGFNLQYYKTFLPILGPYMVKLFNAVGSDTVFPRETLKAHMSVIPNEGKDPTLCGSYRPCSLRS